MNRESALRMLVDCPIEDNLREIVNASVELAKSSEKFVVHDSYDDREPHLLPAKHYFNGFARRLKNPNGVARNTLGYQVTMDNFGRCDENLRITIIELDRGASVSFWATVDERIVGCVVHPEGSDARS